MAPEPATPDGTPPAATVVGPGPSSTDQPPGRSGRRLAVVGGIVVLAAAGIAVGLLAGDDSVDQTAEAVQLRAVTAEQRDLIEYTDLDGTLGYADTFTVAATEPGTILAIVDDGDQVSRGDTVFELDGKPVVVFHGAVPLYRTLEPGVEGDDVAMLEANLASLGYHTELDDDDNEIDRGFVVDDVFDAATTDAVRAWQADLGLEETGVVQPGDVVVTAGPSIASNIRVDVGTVVSAGSPVLDLSSTEVVEAVYGRHAGELDLEVTAGPISSGQVLYTVDDRPVTAVVTDEPLDRELFDGVADGEDVTAVERMLVALGYDAGGDLVVDDSFDEYTAEAVEDWQDDLRDEWDDVVADGVLDPEQVIPIRPGASVGAVTEREADLTASGSELFTYSTTDGSRVVETAIDVVDQAKLSEGASVDIEFPDGSLVAGVVTKVATSSTIDPTDPNADPQLAVEIAVADIPASASGLNELDVEVKLVDELAAGVTVVPASALVVTADGGFAVEVVTGASTTSYVAVEPGMFADGFVEVAGIEPGTAVVVPS
jgi:peptidoglycan hydrolase-like protein with peptidoglycan-binding domain